MATNPQAAAAAFQARMRAMVQSSVNPQEIGKAVQDLVQSCLDYGHERRNEATGQSRAERRRSRRAAKEGS